MNGPDKLRLTVSYNGVAERAEFIKYILKSLS